MKRTNIIFTSIVAVCALISMSMNNFRTLGVIQETAPLSFHSEDKGISTGARAHLSTDTDDKFIKGLLSKGYILLEVEVRNQTSISYELSQDSINLPHTTSKEIASNFAKGAIPRSIAFKIIGFFFWPMMIPSAIDTIVTCKTHRALKYDLGVKTLKKDGETILPYSVTKRFIFIKEADWQEWTKHKNFDITLKESSCQRLLTITTPLE